MKYLKGEVYFPIIVGIHLVLWAVDLKLFAGSFALAKGEAPIQRIVGEIMSSWVVTVFGFNLLMATRARWVERLFGGLDKMYVIHRRSGVLAGVILLLHFGTVPRVPDFSIGKPMGFVAMALILLGIAFAAAPLMKRKLTYRKWLGGHRLMGVFYVVGVAHAAFVPTLISKLPLVRSYVLGMAIVGVGSWLYRAFFARLLRRPLPYRVEGVRRFGNSVVEITMASKGEALAFEAGQFAFFSFERLSQGESHPFTIASSPAASTLRIAVKGSGDFTSRLVEEVSVGMSVRVEGPYGHLTQEHCRSDEQLWFAGGIGVTPFLALAPSLDGTSKKVKLYWTVRSNEEAHFDDELKVLAAEVEGFEYELWCSNEKGRLSATKAGVSFRDKAVLICGPLAMRDSLAKQAKSGGTPARGVHYEEFSFR